MTNRTLSLVPGLAALATAAAFMSAAPAADARARTASRTSWSTVSTNRPATNLAAAPYRRYVRPCSHTGRVRHAPRCKRARAARAR